MEEITSKTNEAIAIVKVLIAETGCEERFEFLQSLLITLRVLLVETKQNQAQKAIENIQLQEALKLSRSNEKKARKMIKELEEERASLKAAISISNEKFDSLQRVRRNERTERLTVRRVNSCGVQCKTISEVSLADTKTEVEELKRQYAHLQEQYALQYIELTDLKRTLEDDCDLLNSSLETAQSQTVLDRLEEDQMPESFVKTESVVQASEPETSKMTELWKMLLSLNA